MRRRQFIKASLSGSATMLASHAFAGIGAYRRRQSRLADSRIEILLNEPIGRIAPEIYGHFAEHLGGVVYGGIWVGEDSRVPNVGGIRKSLIDALQRVKPSVVRWPGGCFADSYNWRDGVGPKSQRPRRTNFWRDAGEWPKDLLWGGDNVLAVQVDSTERSESRSGPHHTESFYHCPRPDRQTPINLLVLLILLGW